MYSGSELTIGVDAYLINRRLGTARCLGPIEQIRPPRTVIGAMDLPEYDSKTYFLVAGQWYDEIDVYSESRVLWIGYHIEKSA